MWPRSDILTLVGLLVGLVSTLAAIHALPNRKTRLWLTISCVLLFVGGVILIRLAGRDSAAPTSTVQSMPPTQASSRVDIRHSSASHPPSSAEMSFTPTDARGVAPLGRSTVASPPVDATPDRAATQRPTVSPERRPTRRMPEPALNAVSNTQPHVDSGDGSRGNSNPSAAVSEQESKVSVAVRTPAQGTAAAEAEQSRESSPQSSRSGASYKDNQEETRDRASQELSPALCDPSCHADFAHLPIATYNVPVSEETLTRIEYVIQLDSRWPIPHYVHIIREYYRSSSGWGPTRKSTIDEDGISKVVLSDSAAHGAQGVECIWGDDECEQTILTKRPSHQYTVRIHGALEPQSFSIVIQPSAAPPPNSR